MSELLAMEDCSPKRAMEGDVGVSRGANSLFNCTPIVSSPADPTISQALLSHGSKASFLLFKHSFLIGNIRFYSVLFGRQNGRHS